MAKNADRGYHPRSDEDLGVTDRNNESLLVATAVVKSFGALTVLDNINFSVGHDEAVGIVGPNGAGKSTMLAVISGSLRSNAGGIRFDNVDMTGKTAAQRCRSGLVRTHQIPKPFGGMTTFENIFVAAAHRDDDSRAEAYDRAIDALRLCGMVPLANRRAEALGLLDRKRLELARALATKPRLLLLDEIGGGLTDAEASELVDVILELRRRQIAIVWIEHIVHVLIRVVQRLICMDAGRIIADGTPSAVLQDSQVMQSYLGRGVK
jgi:branched-chain amino acid transport system ATP-binding protein